MIGVCLLVLVLRLGILVPVPVAQSNGEVHND